MSRLQDGDIDGALSLLRTLVKQTPSDGHVHALIGICHAQQGNLDAAVKALETAALLNPQDAAVEYNLANALFQIGRNDQAKWRLSRIIDEDPDHQDAKLLLAHIQKLSAPPAAVGAPMTPKLEVAGRHGAQRLAPPAPNSNPSAPELTCAPGMGLRLLRGAGWGLVYSLGWTFFSLFAALTLSLFTTRVEHAIVAFLVMAALSALFHGAMGLLTGLVAAVLNADEDAGAWVGMCVGFLILLIGVRFGLLAMWAVVFYIFMGRWIGRCVAARVQKSVAG